MHTQSDTTKFMALRAKTDQELYPIVVKELDRALRLAERSPAKARKAHHTASALVAGMGALSEAQRMLLEQKLACVGERVREVETPANWFAAGAAAGPCARQTRC